MPTDESQHPPKARKCSGAAFARRREASVPSGVARPSIIRLPLAVEEEQRADHGECDCPDAAGHAVVGGRQPELEPARPPDEDGQDAQRRVGDLDEELGLQVEERVRVGEEPPPAGGAQEGEDVGPPRGAEAPGAHRPLEGGEGHDERHRQPVLEDVGEQHALPEAGGAERPRARIVAEEENAASPRKRSGQCRAQRLRPRSSTSASNPMLKMKSPATWWLNSDHWYSGCFRTARVSVIGAAAASRSSIRGVEKLGSLGGNRPATSASVARSSLTSAATGRVPPPPPPAPTTHQRLAGTAPPRRAMRRTARKFRAASASAPASTATFVRIMIP